MDRLRPLDLDSVQADCAELGVDEVCEACLRLVEAQVYPGKGPDGEKRVYALVWVNG